MSFEKSMPGKSPIAKTAVKGVTANRNPNRTVVVGKTPTEESDEKKETDSELRAQFDETIAREFGSKGKSSFQQFQQLNSANQISALNNPSLGALSQSQAAPKMPSFGGGGSSSGSNKSQRSNSNPSSQSLQKPNLIDDTKTKPRTTQKPEAQKISPLAKPGQNSNSQNSKQETSRSETRSSTAPAHLAQGVASDANRVSALRGFESPDQSRALSQTILSSFTQNSDKHSISDAGVRRLVNHGIPFKENFFDPKNSPEKNDEISNKIISARNESTLAKLHGSKELAGHYKDLGFKRGDYSQQTAKQFKESYNYIQQVKNNPSSKAEKQALVLLPEKGAAQFDMVNEVEDLKKLGFTPVFAQINSEDSFKLYNGDGTKTPIKQLADDLGGFDLAVLGGHGQNSKTPGIKFGDEFKITNPQDQTQVAKAEKAFLDKTDFRDDKGVVNFFKDTSILKEGGTLASCSCSFTGSKDSRGADHIKPEESLASIFQEIRPDADIMGAFDEVFASDSKYTMGQNGQLENPTMRRLEEPQITQELLSQNNLLEDLQQEDSPLDQLDDIFADDYADDLMDELDELID